PSSQQSAAASFLETPALERAARRLDAPGGTLVRKYIGPYEVRSLLGSGGMGEVYRAHDHRLKRDIALKILPEALASDPERQARFEREAQAIAALNHPNIVTIHSIEEADGVLFLTMELVEGKTLTET